MPEETRDTPSGRTVIVRLKPENLYPFARDVRQAFQPDANAINPKPRSAWKGRRTTDVTMPAVLKRLMRHADVSTTMGFDVELDTGGVSAQL